MANLFGRFFRIMTWGESHGKAMGVIIDGCPSRIFLTRDHIQKDLNRRRPGQSQLVSQRNEPDQVQILSGIFENYTIGSPISLLFWNLDQKSRDYSNLENIFRPGHAEYTYFKKYGHYDYRGGGRSSARETISRVAAAAVAKKVLEPLNLKVYAYTLSIGYIKAKNIVFEDIDKNDLRTPDLNIVESMRRSILKAQKEGTSLGGVVEICIFNAPSGWGDPIFHKLDSELAKAIMSIGAVKGVEIGAGFEHQFMKGHESNDQWISEQDQIKTRTNFSGGIVGGISTGMPIILRAVIKASSSVGKKQKTVSKLGHEEVIQIKGRHDPCILPRVVPVIESMIFLTLCDFYLSQKIYT